jgi:hypothetical protein
VTIVVSARPASPDGVALDVREASSNGTATARVLSRVEEGAIAALMKVTGNSRLEARGKVIKAVQMLSSLGRAATLLGLVLFPV